MATKTALRINSNFMKLWSGQTVSQVGSNISGLAIPLIAVLMFHASPYQMGILGFLTSLPFFLLSLFIGVWIDRVRRWPLLVSADIGRAILLGMIPFLIYIKELNFLYLCSILFLTESLTVLFDLTYLSYLPSIIPKDALADGNSKLQATQSIAQVAGPSLAGLLIQWLSASLAVLADSASFVMSVISLLLIRQTEQPPSQPERRRSFVADIRTGFAAVHESKILKVIVSCTATLNFFGNAFGALIILYVVKQVGISAGKIGMVFSLGSIGALVASLIATKIGDRLGTGGAIVLGAALSGGGAVVMVLASKPIYLALTLISVGQFVSSFGSTLYFIHQVSYRQVITPKEVSGRVNATMRFISRGMMPIGAILGGLLGEAVGLHLAILISAIGTMSSVLWLVFSRTKIIRAQEAAKI